METAEAKTPEPTEPFVSPFSCVIVVGEYGGHYCQTHDCTSGSVCCHVEDRRRIQDAHEWRGKERRAIEETLQALLR